MSKVITSNAFIEKWAEAMGLDLHEDKPVRVVIDANLNAPLRIYVERYGTDRLLDIVPPDASGVDITVV